MFLLRENARQIFEEYSEFRLEIEHFKEYCLMYKQQWGNDRDEYISLLKSFERAYERFSHLYGEYVQHDIEKFITRVNAILHRPKFTRQSVDELYHLAEQLEMKCDDELLPQFLEKRALKLSSDNFSAEIIKNVSVLIDVGQFDSAVVEAFKAFEDELTSLLNTSPSIYSGSKLADYAFGESGKIQLNTTTGEQQGLRNLYASAFALFRNPSAHHAVGHDEISTNTIVALLGLVMKIAKSSYQAKND